MAPLATKYPYQRFDHLNPDAEKPNKVLLNADGFATGWFNIISEGSFSGKRSFATLHPAFLDQVFLNRHKVADGVSITTEPDAIEVPAAKAVWPAPDGLKNSDGRPISPRTGQDLTIVRVGMTDKAIKAGGTFTPSQLRLVCKQKDPSRQTKNPLAGRGKNIYPVGYLKTASRLQEKKLSDRIKLERGDLEGRVKYIDFVFYIPNGFVPVLVEFKQNCLAQLPSPVTTEEAPPPAPFIPLANCATESATVKPIASAKVYGLELATDSKLMADLKLEISDANQWRSIQTDRSIKPAQFDNEQISYVRAELKIEKPAEWRAKEQESKASAPSPEEPQQKRRFTPRMASAKKPRSIRGMFKPLDGYKLLSLKCNNPSTGMAMKAEQLPSLVESSGLVHHPVGVIASGEVGDQIIYEVDYCSLTDEDTTDGLTISEDGSVSRPFPDTVWLTEQAQSITEFYVLYLVKSNTRAVIISIQPGDSQPAAGLKEYEGFFIK